MHFVETIINSFIVLIDANNIDHHKLDLAEVFVIFEENMPVLIDFKESLTLLRFLEYVCRHHVVHGVGSKLKSV